MGSSRHSPCLDYLSATLFILAISLQCANSLNGVFKVQTKYIRKPFPTLPPHLRHHHRMLLDSNPVDIAVKGGNATVPLYIMDIAIGTPPQPHKVIVDTGSADIWVNCAGCVNCIFDSDGVHIPPYDPSLSTTSRIYNFTEDHCAESVNGSRCRFIVEYAGERGMEGYVMEDKFLIGNPLTGQSISTEIRFGCVTKHNYTRDEDGFEFIDWGIDGIIGFGDFGDSLVKQFNRTGIRSNQLAHCLDNINGGGIFAIGNVMEPQVPMVDRWDRSYTLGLMDIDFGGAKVALNGSSSIAGFDCGSDKFYVPTFTFQDVNEKFEALLTQKNAVLRKRVNDSTCFQLPGKTLTPELVDQEFPNITLHFPGSMLFNVTPHNYIRPEVNGGDDLKGFWCLFVSPLDIQAGEYYIYLVGSSFMSEKLVVFDNVNTKVGFVDHDCSVPIQVEGEDGKPVSLGPQLGN